MTRTSSPPSTRPASRCRSWCSNSSPPPRRSSRRASAKLVYRDLEKVGLEKEIRSGVVIVGGGAEMDGMVEMSEQIFDQSARRGVPRGLGGLSDTVAGPEWAAAAGLLLWGFKTEAK